jgi:hypothetical protein
VTDDSLDAALAERLARASRAAQDLCDVLWEALHEELSDRSREGPRAQRVAELSERVADVSSTVAALALAATRDLREREPPVEAESALEGESALEPEEAEPTLASAAPGAPAAPASSPPRSRVVIVDEREEALAPLPTADLSAAGRSPIDPPTLSRVAREDQTSQEQPTRARPLPWDEPPRQEMRVTRRAASRPSVDEPA